MPVNKSAKSTRPAKWPFVPVKKFNWLYHQKDQRTDLQIHEFVFDLPPIAIAGAGAALLLLPSATILMHRTVVYAVTDLEAVSS